MKKPRPKKSNRIRKVCIIMLKFISKHPIMTFLLITIVLCVIAGPRTVGAWYSGAVSQTAAGVVAFFQGVF